MKDKTTKRLMQTAAWIVLALCVYSFLIANRIFRGGFENDAISWYILAKGIFCSIVLLFLANLISAHGRPKT